jgi:pyruvate/2-oxoglutarate dehydrogenase complex dihydrolipoamide acyltransferase (E2) component
VTEIRIPKPGDAIVDGTIARWLAPDGALVREGQLLYLLETDKAELEIEAPASGRLRHVGAEGGTYPVGEVIATIE